MTRPRYPKVPPALVNAPDDLFALEIIAWAIAVYDRMPPHLQHGTSLPDLVATFRGFAQRAHAGDDRITDDNPFGDCVAWVSAALERSEAFPDTLDPDRRAALCDQAAWAILFAHKDAN